MTASASLMVPYDVEFAGARDIAANLAAEIAAADPGVAFQLELSAPDASVLAVQIAEACRKTLLAAGRLKALGPAAAAALEAPGFADDRRGAPA